jgi:hypothetical protein
VYFVQELTYPQSGLGKTAGGAESCLISCSVLVLDGRFGLKSRAVGKTGQFGSGGVGLRGTMSGETYTNLTDVSGLCFGFRLCDPLFNYPSRCEGN